MPSWTAALVLCLGLCARAGAQDTVSAPIGGPNQHAADTAADAHSAAAAPAASAAQGAPAAHGGGTWTTDRSLLAAEIDRLEHARAELSLGGPIAMLIGGGVVLASGGLLLLITALSDAWCNGEDGFEDRCSGPDDAFYVVSGVAILGGGVLGLVGLLQLLDRTAERRRLAIRIKELRQALSAAESYGLYIGPERAAFALRLRF